MTLFITLTLATFLAAQYRSGKRQRIFYLSMFAAAALAMMTKGLIGIAIPGLGIGVWMLLTQQWNILKQVPWISGIALFLLIAAPWHVLMAMKHPDFLSFYFIHEHFTRYLTDEHKRTAPWWFFIAITAVGLLPWTGLLPAGFRNLRAKIWPLAKAEPTALFLTLWIVLPLVFFSCSHSKLVPYIFPIFPPLAIVLGNILAQLWEGKLADKSLRLAMFFTVAVFALAIAASRLAVHLPGKAGLKLMPLAHISAFALFPLIIAVVALLYAIISRCLPRTSILMLMGFGAVASLSVNFIAADLDEASVKPLVQGLLPHLKDDDMVVAYHTYWQDLPVYLNRNVTVVDWTGELGFGVEHYPETKQWMIGDDEFWKRCAATKHVFVFMSEEAAAAFKPPHSCTLQPMGEYGVERKTVLMGK